MIFNCHFHKIFELIYNGYVAVFVFNLSIYILSRIVYYLFTYFPVPTCGDVIGSSTCDVK